MYPMENPIEYLPQNENSVAARAETEGRDPEEWLYDFLAENDSQNLIYIPATSKSKDKIAELLKHPHTVEALAMAVRMSGQFATPAPICFAHQMGV